MLSNPDPLELQQTALSPKEKVRSFDVLGVPISVTSLKSAADTILNWENVRQGRFVCVRDVHGIMRAQEDPALMALHQQAGMVTADGMPLVLIGKWRGEPVSRTCGADLMALVCQRSVEKGLTHYLYGGEEGVANELKKKLEAHYPGIRIVGTECPPFRELTEEEDAAATHRILSSGANLVWVGMSTPKQEFWMRDHVERLPATLIGVGAAYDFHTGRVRRAPRWMQRFALEWLHRLLSEPRRLWRRYLVLGPKFVWAVLRG